MVVSAIAWSSILPAIQAWVVAATGLPDGSVYWEGQGANRGPGPFIVLSVPSIYQPAHDWRRNARNPLLGQGPSPTTTIVSVDPDTGEIVAMGHRFVDGDGPIGIVSDGGEVPIGLDTSADYWAVVVDDDTLQLADTFIHSGCNYPGLTVTPIDSFGNAGSGALSFVLRDNAVRAGKEVTRTSEGMREVTVQLEAFGARDQANNATGNPPTPKQLLTDVLASAPLFVDALDVAGAGISTLGIADIQDGVRMINVKVGTVDEQRAQTQISIYVNSNFSIVGGKVDALSISTTAKTPGGANIDEPDETIVVDE